MPIDLLSGVLRAAMGGSAAANKNFEPQRTSNALLRVDLGAIAAPGMNIIGFSVSTMALPKMSNGIIEIGFFNEKRKFAGMAVYDDLSVTLVDYLDTDTVKAMLAWRYKVSNPETGAVGLAASYKKTGEITLFGPNGVDSTQRVWKLYGMWPSQFDHGEVDMNGDDVVRCNVTFTIDKAVPADNLNPNGSRGIPG